jgi:flagellar basal body-associated protein FliL
MDISIECKASVCKEVRAKNGELQNTVLLLSSEYTVAMLAGMDGKMALKDAIESRLNKVIGPQRMPTTRASIGLNAQNRAQL